MIYIINDGRYEQSIVAVLSGPDTDEELTNSFYQSLGIPVYPTVPPCPSPATSWEIQAWKERRKKVMDEWGAAKEYGLRGHGIQKGEANRAFASWLIHERGFKEESFDEFQIE